MKKFFYNDKGRTGIRTRMLLETLTNWTTGPQLQLVIYKMNWKIISCWSFDGEIRELIDIFWFIHDDSSSFFENVIKSYCSSELSPSSSCHYEFTFTNEVGQYECTSERFFLKNMEHVFVLSEVIYLPLCQGSGVKSFCCRLIVMKCICL